MANTRHKPEEIFTKLRQVEVFVSQGKAGIDAIRDIRISEQTYYRWRVTGPPYHFSVNRSDQ